MADPFARLQWMGRQVLCYLQPGCEIAELDRLAEEVRETCAACCTEADLDAELEAVAERHRLRVTQPAPGVASDPVVRIVSFGYMPPFR